MATIFFVSNGGILSPKHCLINISEVSLGKSQFFGSEDNTIHIWKWKPKNISNAIIILILARKNPITLKPNYPNSYFYLLPKEVIKIIIEYVVEYKFDQFRKFLK